ncbi:MAG: peptidyl-alpha-hydroxyglycine alpha-amidating lyase family protein [Vicinamibacterales bacterium]
MSRSRFLPAAILAVIVASLGVGVASQAKIQPINDRPNPYKTSENVFKLPDSRVWGSTSAVDIDRDGTSIWVAERCGANTCAGSHLAPVLKFDASGKLLTSFGAGMFIFPHGIHVDRDGNVWITDAQGNKEGTIGHQVIKFSPDGRVLMRLGKAGVPGNTHDTFNEPNDVVTAANGDIFVADGHSGQNPNPPANANARIVKFDRDGKFIREWGSLGAAPGQFRTPHSLAMDAKGRLFVADRGNVRIQIFDQDGKFLQETKAFSRSSGIFIKDDILYSADSESSASANPGWKRGIRIGPIGTLMPQYFIPDPQAQPSGTSAAEGVAVDAAGNVYGAEVGPRAVKKYVKQ